MSADEQRRAERSATSRAHWRDNLRVMVVLLAIWFVVSYVLSILLVEPLNAFRLGGFPLGFWFAQQGSIYVFVVLIFVYARWMDRIDRRHGEHEGGASPEAGDDGEGSTS